MIKLRGVKYHHLASQDFLILQIFHHIQLFQPLEVLNKIHLLKYFFNKKWGMSTKKLICSLFV